MAQCTNHAEPHRTTPCRAFRKRVTHKRNAARGATCTRCGRLRGDAAAAREVELDRACARTAIATARAVARCAATMSRARVRRARVASRSRARVVARRAALGTSRRALHTDASAAGALGQRHRRRAPAAACRRSLARAATHRGPANAHGAQAHRVPHAQGAESRDAERLVLPLPQQGRHRQAAPAGRHARRASTRPTSSAARVTATSCATGAPASTVSRRASGSASAQRRSCPACHDPHEPRFPLMTPEHAPARCRARLPPTTARAQESA